LIHRAVSNIDFKGLEDGTLNLILRKSFEKEIKEFAPDLKQEFSEIIATLTHTNKQLQGKINSLTGRMVLAAYLSLGGLTDEAGDFCLEHGIGVAERIEEL